MAWQERFWSYVAKGPYCWEWQRSLGASGYGQFYIKKDPPRGAHRVSYELTVGPIPEGMCVLHRCDNRRCVRPDHLFLGTKKDNSQDMLAKHRHRCGRMLGEQQPRSKLTESDVLEIRSLASSGPVNMAALARQYEVSRTLIRYVITGKNWTHVRA